MDDLFVNVSFADLSGLPGLRERLASVQLVALYAGKMAKMRDAGRFVRKNEPLNPNWLIFDGKNRLISSI